jgi:hypothetical protein
MPPHDPLFKSLFRTFFDGLLRLLAPELAARLDLAAVSFLDKELISTAPRDHRVVDLLAKVPLRSRDRFLLIHVEIENRSRRGMGKRLRDYQRSIQARHEDPVLSIVVYLTGGKAGIREEVLDGDLAAPGLTSFRYLSFGLARCSAAEYLESPEPLAWALAALMDRGDLSRAELKRRCLTRIAEARLKYEDRWELANCVETYLELTPEEAEEFSLRATPKLRRAQTMLFKLSWADKMQGQAVQSTVLSILETRFGAVPEEVRTRIQKIYSLDRLNRLACKAATARTLKSLRLGG